MLGFPEFYTRTCIRLLYWVMQNYCFIEVFIFYPKKPGTRLFRSKIPSDDNDYFTIVLRELLCFFYPDIILNISQNMRPSLTIKHLVLFSTFRSIELLHFS
jgi:hypothetical protein